jgi:hypothetical protein
VRVDGERIGALDALEQVPVARRELLCPLEGAALACDRSRPTASRGRSDVSNFVVYAAPLMPI